jgi:BirA family biotin operon repressor/biotin-[acetyl-CoA-carboxylase] ligase
MSVKDQVLGLLEKSRGDFVSGGQFASEIGVSRTAVWKAVGALRDEGYPIEAVTNKGYKLGAKSSILSLAGMKPHLDDVPEILILRSIDSTNNEAKRIISDAGSADAVPYGTVIIAEEQTAGRGRRGRAFVSPASGSLYMSFILAPAERAGAPFMVTIMAAVAVCEAIEELSGISRAPGSDAKPQSHRPLIKWVNDIFVGGRKICGILTEAISDVESGSIESIVLGIGININVPQKTFPKELRQTAGSLMLDPGERNRFAAALVSHVTAGYEKLREGVSPIEEYRSRSLVIGREITVLAAKSGTGRTATAREILDDGGLLVEYEDGSTQVLRTGEVSIRI